MTTGHIFIATSLDGFVARRNHQLDWLMKQKTAGENHGYDDFIKSVDGIIMGRGSFENVLTFDEWPYALPVVVMSRSLTEEAIPPALRDKVQLSALEPEKLMELLSTQGWRRAYVDGGLVVQSFIRAELISDIVLTTIPILLGDGLRLFGPLDSDIDLELTCSTSFPSGLVKHCYALKPNTKKSN